MRPLSGLTRDEVIERYCTLQQDVYRHLADFRFASDGFCTKCLDRSPSRREDYRNDAKALEFIEEVVRAAIANRQAELELLVPDIESHAERVSDELAALVASVRERVQGGTNAAKENE